MKRTSPPRRPPAVVLIAIAGRSGSGKTWLAHTLQRRLGRSAGLISLDDFYRDLSHLPLARRARTNFDSPAAIDWDRFEADLRAIAAGGAPVLPRYDFAHHTRAAAVRQWRPRPIVIIEGLWPWVKPRLRRLFALRIYRAVDPGTCYRRRLERDIQQRGRLPADVERQWRTQVEPMCVRHVRPQEKQAHLVFDAIVAPSDLTTLARRIRALPGRALTR